MSAIRWCIVLSSLVVLGASCEGDVTCPAWSFPAVSVHVTSAGAGTAILTARGEIRDGGYRDSLLGGEGGYYSAGLRAGTYAVRVESESFAPWDTAGVVATETGGACSVVQTEDLEVRLTPTQ
jgi:hypothetical protein